MHLTLTDHLTCPRCGPTVGLILFMQSAAERRVVTGALGCPACRTQYPIAGRVADLRAGGDAGARPGPPASAGVSGEAVALRVAALLEPGDARGFVLLDGPLGLGVAAALAPLLPGQEAVVAIGLEQADAAGALELSALLDSGALPIGDRAMRGAAWVGGVPGVARLAELVRVCRPTGRVVVETAGVQGDLDATAARLEALGAQMRARDATGLVAVVF